MNFSLPLKMKYLFVSLLVFSAFCFFVGKYYEYLTSILTSGATSVYLKYVQLSDYHEESFLLPL